jgi:hypothetical protein
MDGDTRKDLEKMKVQNWSKMSMDRQADQNSKRVIVPREEKEELVSLRDCVE